MTRKEIRDYLTSKNIPCSGYLNSEFTPINGQWMFLKLFPLNCCIFKYNKGHFYMMEYKYDNVNKDFLDYQLRRYMLEIKIKLHRDKIKKLEKDFEA